MLKLRQAKVLTPYIPEAWEQWLRACNLVNRYPSIPDGLRHGFHTRLSNIANSFTPPSNNPSIKLHASMFKEIVDKEFTKGCYIGPFDLETITDLLDLIQTAPLSLVPKPGKPGKFRLVVKSGSSGLKSDGGSSREIEVSYRGRPEVRRRYKSGDLVRTWHRLMCHALAEVIVLDFRGTEVQRYGGEWRHEGGL